jgi:cytochrome c
MRKPRFALQWRLATTLPLAAALAACGGGGGGSTSADAGRAAVAACGACHSFEQSAPHKSGPNLWGVVGRKAGSAPGYNYSAAMGKSSIVWSPETLDRFLNAPAESVPGTRMMVPTPDPERRKAVIEYLTREGPK